ncbi:hypothetical protein [Streptomyces globisporus]|uniref:hypothetical protein n=1 Tax=Streptomyces globisporus TaxID=1908 RepID=UPI0037ACA5DC
MRECITCNVVVSTEAHPSLHGIAGIAGLLGHLFLTVLEEGREHLSDRRSVTLGGVRNLLQAVDASDALRAASAGKQPNGGYILFCGTSFLRLFGRSAISTVFCMPSIHSFRACPAIFILFVGKLCLALPELFLGKIELPLG